MEVFEEYFEILIIEENLNEEELKHVENYYDRTVPDNIRLNVHRVIATKKEILEQSIINQKKHQYWKNEKYKLKAKLRTMKKIKCDICNIEFRRDGLKRHLASKKHIHNICIL